MAVVGRGYLVADVLLPLVLPTDVKVVDASLICELIHEVLASFMFRVDSQDTCDK